MHLQFTPYNVFMDMILKVLVCLQISTLLLGVTVISITIESCHNTTKAALCMAMKTKAAHNESAPSEEYLNMRQATPKEPE